MDREYKNLDYISKVFETITILLLLSVMLHIYQHNMKPVLLLVSASSVFFVCTMSLLGERNKNTIWV
jgi:hypothetical protein